MVDFDAMRGRTEADRRAKAVEGKAKAVELAGYIRPRLIHGYELREKYNKELGIGFFVRGPDGDDDMIFGYTGFNMEHERGWFAGSLIYLDYSKMAQHVLDQLDARKWLGK